jgi:coenzyme F420-reducing hydrogenase delta subunit/Pyruvate/2-oxoacid:ferredoxin oxidoreductase delta subunit
MIFMPPFATLFPSGEPSKEMKARLQTLRHAAWRPLAAVDGTLNRLYGWRFNPLYQSGALAVLLLAVVSVTGLYLLLFYRIGAPWESVDRISGQAWSGRWIRGLHRYASDAALVAVGVHALRMFAQGRSWGPRALAWISGVLLTGLVLLCGWTGYVMVWDVQAQALAVAGARMLDALPLFGEPISRTFVGESPMPGQFFFLNLFLHIAVPVGMGIVLWVHVARLARPTLIPPRGVWSTAVLALLALSVLWPVEMAPRADLLRLPGEVPLDLFYAIWLPVVHGLPGWAALASLAALSALVLSIPLWTRPRADRRPPASDVDERLCTGCVQCSLDCPYEAIAMVARADGRAELLAHVDPARCVSCGICSGSCAPMGVGPPGRTGRDQLADLRTVLSDAPPSAGQVVVLACDRGLGDPSSGWRPDGARMHPVPCAGNLHSSIVEQWLRAGAAGVLVLACPPRDCWNREGPVWARERLFHDREAELHQRVDRRRVRLAYASRSEHSTGNEELARFRAELSALAREETADLVDPIRECEPALEAVE